MGAECNKCLDAEKEILPAAQYRAVQPDSKNTVQAAELPPKDQADASRKTNQSSLPSPADFPKEHTSRLKQTPVQERSLLPPLPEKPQQAPVQDKPQLREEIIEESKVRALKLSKAESRKEAEDDDYLPELPAELISNVQEPASAFRLTQPRHELNPEKSHLPEERIKHQNEDEGEDGLQLLEPWAAPQNAAAKNAKEAPAPKKKVTSSEFAGGLKFQGRAPNASLM